MSKKSRENEDTFFHLPTSELDSRQAQQLLTGGIAPRPIAFVSTISKDGYCNLAPFSFFNAFGANPPIVVFSPARKGRDGTTKDTYHNIVETRECVVQMVSHSIVEQMSVASAEYPDDVDEFEKSGLTKVPSDFVKPFRVLESPFQMECEVIQIFHTGGLPGSGILMICKVLQFHIRKDLYVDGKVQVQNMDHVGRNGGAFYTRADQSSMFEIHQPVTRLGIGYDKLPKEFLKSKDLLANDLGQLASVEKAPTLKESRDFVKTLKIKKGKNLEVARELLDDRKSVEAWKVLLDHYAK